MTKTLPVLSSRRGKDHSILSYPAPVELQKFSQISFRSVPFLRHNPPSRIVSAAQQLNPKPITGTSPSDKNKFPLRHTHRTQKAAEGNASQTSKPRPRARGMSECTFLIASFLLFSHSFAFVRSSVDSRPAAMRSVHRLYRASRAPQRFRLESRSAQQSPQTPGQVLSAAASSSAKGAGW